jgi:nucleoside-diphosphate-sugar epimerase
MPEIVETVLITGGNGKLGRLFGEKLLRAGHRVVKFAIHRTIPAIPEHPIDSINLMFSGTRARR